MELFETLLYSQTGEGQVFSTDPVSIPGIEDARPLTLYLPPDYLSREDRTYPIAYLFDGQNLYDRAEWPIGWNLHNILDARAAAGLDVPIVVGIHHGLNRDEELCPWPAESGQTPRGDALLDWIVATLHPQLSGQLRIDDRPERRMVGGSSLGGLLALYAGFRHSDFFGKVMSMSPSLWVGQGAIYDYIAEAAFLHNLDFLRLYIDCGALEADEEWAGEEAEAWSDDFWYNYEDQDQEQEIGSPDENEEGDASDENAESDESEAGDESDESDESSDSDEAEAMPADGDAESDAEADPERDSEADSEPDSEPDPEADAVALAVHEATDDEWETDPLEDAEYLVDILRAKGFVEGYHFQWIADPEGEHNEWHWSKRLPLAFAYLFDDEEGSGESYPDSFGRTDAFGDEEVYFDDRDTDDEDDEE